jgi:hypothetical protein
MTRPDIERLRDLLAEATDDDWYTVEDPWRAKGRAPNYEFYPTYIVAGSPDPHGSKMVVDAPDVDMDPDEDGISRDDQIAQGDADLALICAAKNTLPALLAYIEELETRDQERLGELSKALELRTDAEQERDQWQRDHERLREATEHTHVASYDDAGCLLDKCKQCGLDLRNGVHRRSDGR